MLLQIWSKMSCSGILPDFSICSGIEELIYFLRGAPRGRPGRGAAHGPSRPPAGSSAATSWEELRPPASDAAPVPPRAIAGDGLGEEGDEKKAGEEKMRGEESDGERK